MKEGTTYEKLYSNPHMDLYYSHEHYLYAEKHGYSSIQDVQAGCLALMSEMVHRRCYRIIYNDRQTKGTWLPAIRWMEDDFIPKLTANKVEKIAYIYSIDIVAQYSLNRLLENEFEFENQAFNKMTPATKWLLDKPHENQSLSSLYVFKTSEGLQAIDYNDIIFISRFDRKTIIQANDKRIEVSKPLSEVMKSLPANQFQRVHKSYIVNIKKISYLNLDSLGQLRAYFKDYGNAYVVVSKRQVQELKKNLRSLLGGDIEHLIIKI